MASSVASLKGGRLQRLLRGRGQCHLVGMLKEGQFWSMETIHFTILEEVPLLVMSGTPDLCCLVFCETWLMSEFLVTGYLLKWLVLRLSEVEKPLDRCGRFIGSWRCRLGKAYFGCSWKVHDLNDFIFKVESWLFTRLGRHKCISLQYIYIYVFDMVFYVFHVHSYFLNFDYHEKHMMYCKLCIVMMWQSWCFGTCVCITTKLVCVIITMFQDHELYRVIWVFP